MFKNLVVDGSVENCRRSISQIAQQKKMEYRHCKRFSRLYFHCFMQDHHIMNNSYDTEVIYLYCIK